MKIKCHKCSESALHGSSIVYGGELYHFCKDCSLVLDSVPNGKFRQIVIESSGSKIDKEMWNARKKRALGEKLWI